MGKTETPEPPSRRGRETIVENLATSLLDVLYIKNQVSFPTIPPSRPKQPKLQNQVQSTHNEVTKLKRDLIDSFDALASHLDTTFTALSTDFALGLENSANVILVGPNIGTPKSRVILAVDGLEMKIGVLREGVPEPEPDDGDRADGHDSDRDKPEPGIGYRYIYIYTYT
ncbi:hypothetical protein BT96DRAFT_1010603 [Gymnopus androsaceus JB14]|uniref:Uncharacterized protein n=1 Tax=Gymnopus androsaceus JB14 TaxID=1447944 RepID=A0A6A4GAF8_9AGAR|nr:hypothetical protein BT96DRAFT_1010603 [Gymnopus androsaceus JB14]